MRRNLLFAITIILTLQCCVQEKSLSNAVKLSEECPKDFKSIIDKAGHKQVRYADLNTGSDSVKAQFLTYFSEGVRRHWIVISINDKPIFLSSGGLSPSKNSSLWSSTINIALRNATKKISCRISHNTEENTAELVWLNKGKKSPFMVVQDVTKPFQQLKPIPDFQVETLSGKLISTEDFRGKFLVINWWTKGIEPCVDGIPDLNKLADKYASNPDVAFLAITKDSKDDLKEFLADNEFKFEHAVTNPHVSHLFDGTFPKYLVVDPEGTIVFYSNGVGVANNTYQDIENALLMNMGV